MTMNGSELSGCAGKTIMEVAQENGVDISPLCHRPELTPSGAYCICVAEVEDLRTPVGSCYIGNTTKGLPQLLGFLSHCLSGS